MAKVSTHAKTGAGFINFMKKIIKFMGHRKSNYCFYDDCVILISNSSRKQSIYYPQTRSLSNKIEVVASMLICCALGLQPSERQ